MKHLETKVGKSLNPNTGEDWWRVDHMVGLEEGDDPTEVFKQIKDLINGWLPNPMPPQQQPKEAPPKFLNINTGKMEY